jgi:hypothetical protein
LRHGGLVYSAFGDRWILPVSQISLTAVGMSHGLQVLQPYQSKRKNLNARLNPSFAGLA